MGSAEQTTLQYLGHSAFLWETPAGARILIDPYRNGPGLNWFLTPFPQVAADVVVVTHPHPDHDNVGAVIGRPSIVQTPVELRGGDFTIRTVMGKHAGEYGHEFDRTNLICVIETASVVFCHVGDNEADLADHLVKQIGPVDVLIVPVDDRQHLLSIGAVNDLIERISPRVVIPTHYLIPGLTEPTSGLGGIRSWLDEQRGVCSDLGGTLSIGRTILPDQRQVWCLADDHTPWAASVGVELDPYVNVSAIQDIHADCAMVSEARVGKAIGEHITMSYHGMQDSSFGEFIQSLTNPSCIYTLSLPPISRRIVIDVPMLLAFALLDIQLEWRPLTPDEMGALGGAIGPVIDALGEAWRHLNVESPTDIGLDVNPIGLLLNQENGVASPDERVICVSTDVRVRGTHSSITVCYPKAGLLEVRDWGDWTAKADDA
jgi:L-ascorbate metabolism protein UlaG (beta-lactamase superfamily)